MTTTSKQARNDLRRAVIKRVAVQYPTAEGAVDWRRAFAENPSLRTELQLDHGGMQPIYALTTMLKQRGELRAAAGAATTSPTVAPRPTERGNVIASEGVAIRFCPHCGTDVYRQCSGCGRNLVNFLMTANFGEPNAQT